MKRLLFFIGLLLLTNTLLAQKKVTENTSANNVDEVSVEFKFANDIVVKNWNKNEISIEASVNIDENKHNDYFSLKTDKVGSTYFVKSDYGDYFKKYRNYSNYKKNIDEDDKENCNCCSHTQTINYVIYVPKNMELKVKSISGSVAIDNYTGVLNTDLISGNITVKEHSKDMHLKTISGDIDIYVKDATLEAKTLTGGVYSDLDIDFNQNKKKRFGSKIVTKVKNGTSSLKLNTISGDIYLRKI